MSQNRVLRIAHAYGNQRDKLEEALRGPVDLIEADIWYQRGAVWVRHERRLGFLPILFDRQQSGIADLGPWAIPIGPWYLRLDINPIRLGELLEKARGKRGLVLDTKGEYSPAKEVAFAQTLARLLGEYTFETKARVCGQNWSLLDRIRQVAPRLLVQYTIAQPNQWQAFLRRLEEGDACRAVFMNHRLLNEERAQLLKGRGIGFLCWTVDQPQEVSRILALGPEGVTSNSLAVLGSLGENN